MHTTLTTALEKAHKIVENRICLALIESNLIWHDLSLAAVT